MKKRLFIYSTLFLVLSMQVFSQSKEELITSKREELIQIRADLEENKKSVVDDYLLKLKKMPQNERPPKRVVQNRIDFIQCGFNNIEKAEKMLDEIIKIENEDEFNEKWDKYDEIVLIIQMYYTRTGFADYTRVSPNPSNLVEKMEELSN